MNDLLLKYKLALLENDEDKQLQQLKEIRSNLIEIVNSDEKCKQEIKEVTDLCRTSFLVVV
jgi:hypothetical protein